MIVKWKSEGEGNWESVCGRFSIEPLFYGSTRPQSYKVTDNVTKKKQHFDRVRECKDWASKQN